MASLVDRLLPEELWQRIQPLLPSPPPRPRGGVPRQVPDRNCAAALVFMARTSTPWARCCQLKSWAAARRPPAGGGWTSGPARGCSSSSRHCCWMNWGRPGGSTLSGSASTLSACGRSKGGPDRRQSHRSGQGRVQAAPGRQARWAAAGTDPERGQRQRLDHAGGGAGGHPGDPHAHRPPAASSWQGACRQGLRSPPLPPLSALARDQAPDRPPQDRLLSPAWPPPLDDRADRGLAGRMATATDPL
jgi:hypothetical protein